MMDEQLKVISLEEMLKKCHLIGEINEKITFKYKETWLWSGGSVGWSVVPFDSCSGHISVAGSIPSQDMYWKQLTNISLT